MLILELTQPGRPPTTKAALASGLRVSGRPAYRAFQTTVIYAEWSKNTEAERMWVDRAFASSSDDPLPSVDAVLSPTV
jgi:hypothetical protein